MIWYLPGFRSRVWCVDGDETQKKKIEQVKTYFEALGGLSPENSRGPGEQEPAPRSPGVAAQQEGSEEKACTANREGEEADT